MSMSKLFSEVSEFLKILFVNPVTNAVREYSWTTLQRFEIFFCEKPCFMSGATISKRYDC